MRNLSIPADLLRGYGPIADHLGVTYDQARHLALRGQLPTFQMGRIRCATRSGLTAWIRAREAEAMLKHPRADDDSEDDN